MKSIMYCLFPYDKDSLYAYRTNDDGTYSIKSWMGKYYQEWGPQKARFDLRQSKPFITTKDFDQVKGTLNEIRVTCLNDDMDSIGFDYSSYDKRIHVRRDFSQAGYNDSDLFVVTTKKTRNEGEIDCRMTVITRTDHEATHPWTREPYIRSPGDWKWHRFDDMKYLNEEALTMIDRPTAYKMALDLFMENWEGRLADFKEWCGVTE